MKNQFNILTLALFVFLSCNISDKNSANNAPILIQKINVYNKIDSIITNKGNLIRRKSDFFIIENFHSKIEDSVAIFDFVRKAKKYTEFDTYDANFYKESSITNLKSIMSGPGEITGDSDDRDLIYSIIWGKNRWHIHSYKSGEELYVIYRDSL